MQQQGNLMQGQQARPNLQNLQNVPAVQIKMTQEDNDAINRLAQQLAATTSPEDRRKIQQNLQNMPADQLQNLRAKGVDLVAAYFRDRATKEWRRQQQGLNANANLTPNMQINSTMQAQRQAQGSSNLSTTQATREYKGMSKPEERLS